MLNGSTDSLAGEGEQAPKAPVLVLAHKRIGRLWGNVLKQAIRESGRWC